MISYLIDPNGQAFVKGYGFLSLAKNMNKNIGKYRSKNLSRKYSQRLLDQNNLPQMQLKLLQKKQFKIPQK